MNLVKPNDLAERIALRILQGDIYINKVVKGGGVQSDTFIYDYYTVINGEFQIVIYLYQKYVNYRRVGEFKFRFEEILTLENQTRIELPYGLSDSEIIIKACENKIISFIEESQAKKDIEEKNKQNQNEMILNAI